MGELTNGRVKISSNTKLLINGSEVLDREGIHGKIHQVGIGFGTGRHLQGRKSHIIERQEIVMSKSKPVQKKKKSKSPKRPIKTTSIGLQASSKRRDNSASPITANTRSAAISPKTQTSKSLYSVGLSAKIGTAKSVRDENEGVSQGRFDPSTIDNQAQTHSNLLTAYLKRPQRNTETATDPVMIVTGRPEFKSTMIQTNPEVAETDIFEPMPLIAPYEPLTRATGANADDDS
jgi:hypothetical protein